MFAGHFAFALLLKARYRNVPMWALLLATNLCDWVWLILSARGVEHFRLYLTLAGAVQIDLYDVPYSHSLFWSAMTALLVFLLFVRAEHEHHWAVPLSIAVFSHWILDWLMCAPTLPFANFGPSLKFGLGLAELFPFAGLFFELLFVLACWWVHDRQVNAAPRWERKAILAMLLLASFAPQILQRLY